MPEEDGEITVAFHVLGTNKKHNLPVRPDLSLRQLRNQLPTSLRSYFDLRFVVSNSLLPRHKEDSVRVIDALPKLFSQDIPHNLKFTFPGVEYQKLLYRVKETAVDVLCALIVQLSPADPLQAEENFLYPLPNHQSADAVSQQYLSGFYESCTNGDEARFNTLLHRWPSNVDPVEYFSCKEDHNHITPLHIAAEHGHLDITRSLIQNFSDQIIDILDNNGHSALYFALQRKHLKVAAELMSSSPGPPLGKQKTVDNPCAILEKYPDRDLLSLTENLSPTVLKQIPKIVRKTIIVAIQNNKTELLRTILPEFSAEREFINYQDEMGWTFLHQAITCGVEAIVSCLVEAGVNPALVDHWGMAPVTLACQQGKGNLIPLLGDSYLNDELISKALDQALKYGHKEAAETLLDHIPDESVLDRKTWNRLICLARSDFKSYAKILKLAPSLDANCVLLNQFLLEAARCGDVETLFTLLTKLNVDVNFQDYMGQTALHEASLAGHSSVVEALSKHADIKLNLQNWRGETALHYAAKAGRHHVVQTLLHSEEIDVKVRDVSGRTPVLAALYWKHGDMLDIFLQGETSHESLFIPDSLGMTALHYASEMPRSILKALLAIHKDQAHSPDLDSLSFFKYSAPNKILKSIYRGDVDEVANRDWDDGHMPLALNERLKVTTKFTCDCKKTLCTSVVCSLTIGGHSCPPKRQGQPFTMKQFSTQGLWDKIATADPPLHLAIKNRDPKLVTLLVQSIDDLKSQDSVGRCPLALAIDLLLPDIVNTILQLHKQYRRLVDPSTFISWLNRCIRAKNFQSGQQSRRCQILELLLQFRSDIEGHELPSSAELELPIAVATSLGLKDCADLLLRHESGKDYSGAILTAITHGQDGILETVLEHLRRSTGEDDLGHNLGCIHDPEGVGVLGKLVQTRGEKGLKIVKMMLKYCPHLVDFPLRSDVRSSTHSFICSSKFGITVIKNYKGNTILELLTGQSYKNTIEKEMWEEVGCCLIENGAGDGVVEVGNGKIVHSSCAALASSIQNGFWKMTQLLFAKGAGKQLWKCALSSQLSHCMQSIGLIIDDIIYYLCQSHVPVAMLNSFLKQGLELEASGEISSNAFAEAQEHRLFWVSQSRGNDAYFDDSTLKYQEMLFRVPENPSRVTSPVERAITLAMQPVVGYMQSKIRFRKYNPPLKLKLGKAPRKNILSGMKHPSLTEKPTPESPVFLAGTPTMTQPSSIPGHSENINSGKKAETDQCNSTPRVVFTPANISRHFMTPHSRKLARSHSLHYSGISAMPSTFYLHASTGTPSPQAFIPGAGPSSPVLSPTIMVGSYTYVTSVPTSPAATAAQQSPLFQFEAFQARKLTKIFFRTPFSTKMMQSLANVLRILPSLTTVGMFASWLAEWKVDTKTGMIPKWSLDDPEARAKYRLDRNTMNLSFAAANHKISLLHEACLQGKLEVVGNILHSADLEYINGLRCRDARTMKFNVTAVGMAAHGGHVDVVEVLLNKGVTPIWPDVMLALQSESANGSQVLKVIVVAILQKLESPGAEGTVLGQAIHKAVKRNCIEAIDILLEKYEEERLKGRTGFCYGSKNEDEWTSDVLKEALKLNHGEIAGLMFSFMSRHGLLSCTDSCELLNLAAKKGQWSLCTSILDSIPDKKTFHQALGEKKMLHYAAAQNQLEFVKKFVSKFESSPQGDSYENITRERSDGENKEENHNAEEDASFINMLDSGKRTPLDYALQFGHTEIIQVLVIYGAVPNKQKISLNFKSRIPPLEYERHFCGSGIFPFQKASEGSADKTLDDGKKLDAHLMGRQEGADSLLRDLLYCAQLRKNLNVSVLHSACCLGLLNVMECVLKERPHLVNKKCRGKSPLFCAVLNGNVEAVELLSNMGATFGDDMYLEAWLLSSCRTQLSSFRHKLTLQEALSALPFWFHRAVNRHIETTIQNCYSQYANLMLSPRASDLKTPSGKRWKTLLATILGALQCDGTKITPDREVLQYLVALLAVPEVTRDVLKQIHLSEGTLNVHRSTKVPLTLIDAILSMNSPEIAEDNINVVLDICPEVKLHPLTLMSARVKRVQPFGELAIADDFNFYAPDYEHYEDYLYFRALVFLMQEEDLGYFEKSINAIITRGNIKWSEDEKNDFLTEVLHHAIKMKSTKAVELLLQLGADPLACTKSGKCWSAFHHACHGGSVDILQALSESVSVVDSVVFERLNEASFHVELAHIASARGHDGVLQWLKGVGLTFNPQNEFLKTGPRMTGTLSDPSSCLRTALLNGKTKTIEWLMNHRGQLEFEDSVTEKGKKSLYHYATCIKDEDYGLDLIQRFHEMKVPGLSLLDEDGLLPLDYSQIMGNLSVMHCILELHGETLPHVAGKKWFISSCPYGALKHRLGNETAISQINNENPLHYIRTKKGVKKSVLLTCFSHGDDEMSYWILKSRSLSFMKHKNPVNSNPGKIKVKIEKILRYACSSGCTKSVRLILEIIKTLNLESQVSFFDSLAASVAKRHLDCAQILIDSHFIDPTQLSSGGESILHIAIRTCDAHSLETVLGWVDAEMVKDKLLHLEDNLGLTPEYLAKSLHGMQEKLRKLINIDPVLPTTKDLLQIFQESPTPANKKALMVEIGRGEIKFITDVCSSIAEGTIPDSELNMSEVFHWIVADFPEHSAKDLLEGLHGIQGLDRLERWKDLSLAEEAYLLGKVQLALWLQQTSGGQFRAGEGLMWTLLSDIKGYHPTELYSFLQTKEIESGVLIHEKHSAVSFQMRAKNLKAPAGIDEGRETLDGGRSTGDEIRERVTERTIPELQGLLNEALHWSDVTVEVNWESFGLNSASDSELMEGEALIDIFHHSRTYGVPYGGLGPVIKECDMYIQTIRGCLGDNVLDNFPYVLPDHITIQKAGREYPPSPGTMWLFEYKEGKVIYDPENFPSWGRLRFAYQASLEWSHSLKLLCSRIGHRMKAVEVCIDWDSFFSVFPSGNVPWQIRTGITDELVRLAKVREAAIHFDQDFDLVKLSLTESIGMLSKSPGSELDVKIGVSKVDDGWTVQQIDAEDFLQKEIIKDFMEHTDMDKVICNIGTIKIPNFVDGRVLPISLRPVVDLDPDNWQNLLRMTLKDPAGPGCIRPLIKKAKKYVEQEALAEHENGLFRINTGLCYLAGRRTEGRKEIFTIIDPFLKETISTQQCKEVGIGNKPADAVSSCLYLNLADILGRGVRFSLKIGPFLFETEWSKENKHCHDIPRQILETAEVLKTNEFLESYREKLCAVLPSLSQDEMENIREPLKSTLMKLEDYCRVRMTGNLKKMLATFLEVKNIYTSFTQIESTLAYDGDTVGNILTEIWSKELQRVMNSPKGGYGKLSTECRRIVQKLIKSIDSGSDGKAVVIPQQCTLTTISLHTVTFPLSSPTFNQSDQTKENNRKIDIELRGIDGLPLKINEEQPEIKITLLNSRKGINTAIPVLKSTQSADSSKVEVEYNMESVSQKLRDDKLGFGWSMGVQLKGSHIKHSPFPIITKPTFNKKTAAESSERGGKWTSPVDRTVSIILLHDLENCTSRKNFCQVLTRSKPTEYLARHRIRSEMAEDGYKHIWALGSVHCYSNALLLCQVESLDPGVFHVQVRPTKSGDSNVMKAFCGKCGKYLKFVLEEGETEKLEFAATAGKPSRVRSRVVDDHFEDIQPTTAPTWTITAGDKLNFFFLPLDKVGNTFNPNIDPEPEFFFMSNSGDHTEDQITAQFVDNQSILEIKTREMYRCGEYSLHMNGHMVGKGEAAYTVTIKPGEVSLAHCTVTGDSFLLVQSGVTAKFTVSLRDAYDNVVEAKGSVAKCGLEVNFSPEKARSYIRYDNGSYLCSYKVDQDFNSVMLMSVTYKDKHLPGSPFSVKWTSVKSFTQRHQALRKALDRMRKKNGKVDVYVNRSSVMQDSYEAISMVDPSLLHYPTHVEFMDERGYDAGGLTREWYQLLSQAIFDPNIALFEKMEDGRYRPYCNSAVQDNHLQYFNFVGKIFAKAIFDGVGLDVHMVGSFYKNILDIPTDFTDLVSEDKALHQSLSQLSTMERAEDVEMLCLTFAADESKFGSTSSYLLKPGGDNIDVTLSNRLEFIQLYTNYICNVRVQEQLEHFKAGFSTVIPLKLLSELTHTELEFIMCGHSEVEVERLRTLTTYEKGYAPGSRPIVWLWNLLESWPQTTRKKFLQFVTGNTRIPACTREWRLYIQQCDTTDKLPTASTCFNILRLPAYGTERQLRSMVTKAVLLGSDGFGNV